MQKITLALTKKDFTETFNKLKEFGYDVKNFNSKRKMGSGITGLPDHMIIGHGYLVYVEVKIGDDKLSPGQKIFAEKIIEVREKNKTVKYWCISQLTEALGIVDYLVEHQN
jgi:hypothetical protein